MGIISGLVRERAIFAADGEARPGLLDDYWYTENPAIGAGGMRVNAETVLAIPAAYACVRVLSETVAQLPISIFRRKKGGGRDEATDHPLLPIIRDMPNSEETSFSWRETAQYDLGFRGNSYSQIIPGRGGVGELIPLHPDDVDVERITNGRKRYKVRRQNGATDLFSPEEIFHIPALRIDRRRRLKGLNPIEVSRQAFGVSLAAQGYAESFFRNNAQPSVILSAPSWGTDEQKKQAEESWKRRLGGAGRMGTAVLEGEIKVDTLTMSNRDAQFIDARKLQAVEVARIFRMPPHMIGILDRATFSNIEQQSIEFVVYTMLPWLRRWEMEINRQLLVNNDIFFTKFNVNGLLRGDILDRMSAHMSAVQAGWKTRNEIRKDEDLNPIPGLDEPLTPGNMAPAGEGTNAARITALEAQVAKLKKYTIPDPPPPSANGYAPHEFEDVAA